MEKLDICIQGQGHSKGSVCQWMFVQIIFSEPQNILLPNLVWWCSIMSQSVMWGKKIVFYLQGQGHIKCSYDQNMTLSTVSSEPLIPLQPNLVWWYGIISQSVFWEKKWLITAFKVKVTVEGQNVSVCTDDFFKMAHIVTKLGIVLHHHELEYMQKDLFAVFKLKVTTRAHITKLWQILVYLQNCWSFCCQTWFGSTLS